MVFLCILVLVDGTTEENEENEYSGKVNCSWKQHIFAPGSKMEAIFVIPGTTPLTQVSFSLTCKQAFYTVCLQVACKKTKCK